MPNTNTGRQRRKSCAKVAKMKIQVGDYFFKNFLVFFATFAQLLRPLRPVLN
jgi:hypothetical protein